MDSTQKGNLKQSINTREAQQTVRDVRQTEPIARPDSGSSAKGFIRQFVVRQTGVVKGKQGC